MKGKQMKSRTQKNCSGFAKELEGNINNKRKQDTRRSDMTMQKKFFSETSLNQLLRSIKHNLKWFNEQPKQLTNYLLKGVERQTICTNVVWTKVASSPSCLHMDGYHSQHFRQRQVTSQVS